MHLKTGAAKVDYKITIEKVLNLPDTNGLLRVEWKRTSDAGKTKAVAAANKEVTFHETVEFTSNLFTEADNLAQKLMQFHLKEKDGSKGVSHGKVSLNLAAHVDLSNKYDKHEVIVDLPLHKHSPNSAVLQIHVWSQPIALKHGRKKVKKNTNGDWVEDNSTTSGSFEVSEDGSKSEGDEKKHRRSLSRKLSIGAKDKKDKPKTKEEYSAEEKADKEKSKKDKGDKSERSKDKKEKSKRSGDDTSERSKEEKKKEKSERKEEKSKEKELRKEEKQKEKVSRSEKEEEKKQKRRADKEKKESEKKSKSDKHSKKPRIPKEGDDHSGSQQESESAEQKLVKGESKSIEDSVSVDESQSTDDEGKKREKEERRRLRKEREEREKKEREEKEKRDKLERKEAREKAKREKNEKSEKSTEASLSESGEGEKKKESRSKSLLRKLTASSTDKPDSTPVAEQIATHQSSKPEPAVDAATPVATTATTNNNTPEAKPIVSTTAIPPSGPSNTADDKASKKEQKKKEKEAKKEKKRIEKENASHQSQSASVESSVGTSELSESESSFSESEGNEKRSADKPSKKSSRLNKFAQRLSISRVERPHEVSETEVAKVGEKTPEGIPNKSGSSAQLELPSQSDAIGEKKVESRENVKKGSSLQDFLHLTKPRSPRHSEGRKDKESKKDIEIKLTSPRTPEKTEESSKPAAHEQASLKLSPRTSAEKPVTPIVVQPEIQPTRENVLEQENAAQLAREKELEIEREKEKQKARELKEKKRLAKKELEAQQLTNALNALKLDDEQQRKAAEIEKEKRKAKAKAKEIEKQKANLEKSAAAEKEKTNEQLREIVRDGSSQSSDEKRSVDIDALDITGARKTSQSVEDMSTRIKEKLSRARNRVSEFDSRNNPNEKRASGSSSSSKEQRKPSSGANNKKTIDEEEVEVVDYVISGSEATLSSDSTLSSSEEERLEKAHGNTNASSSTRNNNSSAGFKCLFDIDKAYPDEKPSDYLFKMILIGDSGVGKSCLMRRWMHDSFGPTSVTVIVECYCKTFPLNDQNVTFHFWDTAGQEKFRSITNTYYRGSHGIMLVYDVENETSFQNIQRWVHDIEPHFPEKPPIMLLIGNKSDTDKRKVTTENGLKLAASLQMFFIETSAKTGEECRRAFAILMEEIFNTNHETEKELRSSDRKSRTATNSQIIKVEENSQPVGKVTKKSCSCSQ